MQTAYVQRAHLALRCCIIVAVLATRPRMGAGQDLAVREEGPRWEWGARAIPLVTRATATPGGRTLVEAYLSQPTLMAGLSWDWLRVHGTLNLEGLTLRRGELLQGAWGEGYVDRRHPHAYLHELMVGAVAGSIGASLFGGRGYVPFGSDDPMLRPFASYPSNHHLAQILERFVLVGALRLGGVGGEVAVFNGDEPVDPSTLPLARRFGDSWSARLTLHSPASLGRLAGAELAGSYAFVKSPEFREGAGLDQRKTHVGLRIAPAPRTGSGYALLEWARTRDVDRGRTLYTFNSVLAEGALCRERGGGIALRAEWSERPEEERLLDAFRAARPATDNGIVGVTHWSTLAASATPAALRISVLRAAPFLEVARVAVARGKGTAFEPALLYGARDGWRLSAGARLAAGTTHERMGRYGVAAGQHLITGHTLQHSPVVRENRCFS